MGRKRITGSDVGAGHLARPPYWRNVIPFSRMPGNKKCGRICPNPVCVRVSRFGMMDPGRELRSRLHARTQLFAFLFVLQNGSFTDALMIQDHSGIKGYDQWAKCHTIKNSTSAVILSRPGRDRPGRREESVLLFYGQTPVTLIPEGYTIIILYKCQVIDNAAEQILRGRPRFAWPQFGIVVQYATAYYTLCLIATSPAFIPHWGRRPPSPAQNDSGG